MEAVSMGRKLCTVELLPIPDDPLFKEKKDLVGHKGNVFELPASLLDDQVQRDGLLDAMLKVARIMNLNEIEWYFKEDGDVGPFSPRNELEALNLILSTLSRCKDYGEGNESVFPLVDMALDRLSCFPVSEDGLRPGTPCHRDIETALLDWAHTLGVKSKLDVAVFEGLGRGCRTIEDIRVGDMVLEIPQSMIICEDIFRDSDMFLALKNLNGINEGTSSLLWSMKERHDPRSKFAPYFASLPESFNTGLSFGLHALTLLDGTTLFEEIIQAREHLRAEYNALFPDLSNCYPQLFPPELYTWNMFLWACELWYSNGLKIAFPDGITKTCLVPIVGLLNHGVYPHITRYSMIDSHTQSLILRAARPCKTGQQCFLSYGAFSNSHLLTFYGFLLNSENPYDVIPLDLDLSDSLHQRMLVETSNLGLAHMLRGSWFSTSQTRPYGLPSRLLSSLCIMLMQEEDAKDLRAVPISSVVGAENEMEAYEVLLSMLTNMLDSLGEPPSPEEGSEAQAWDISLAIAYKDSQRKLLQSACTSCSMSLQDLTAR